MNTPAERRPEMPRRMLFKAGLITAGAAGAAAVFVPSAAQAAKPVPTLVQSGWRWCNRCQCLFYGGGTTTGWCTLGGGHNYGGSGNYIPNSGSGAGQAGWLYCNRCYAMWFGGSSSDGRCPAGGTHSRSGSGAYFIEYGTPPYGQQTGWRWCNKCYCLAYSGNGTGYCPAGGAHYFDASGAYYLNYG